jgi:serine/threonine-protein kinase
MAIKCPKCYFENPDDTIYCGKCTTPLKLSDNISATKTFLTPAKGLTKGSTFAGRYNLIEELGRGGMGVVYKAEDTKLKRTVALKFLPPELTHVPEIKERFMREAQAAAALDHPNICTVHEFDEAEEKTFISMAYIEGQSLRKKIESGPLELDEILRIATQVAEGLQEAHKRGIIHRDIKSPNIMVDERDQAKIMDFGLARVAGGSLITQEGTTMGTIAYMSPEQARGEEVDHRTDIWSFGVVLYEMLSEQLPFKGEKDSSILYSIEHREPTPLKEIKPKIPAELDQVVKKALAKNPDERYQNMDELLDDLYSISKGFVPPKIKAAIRKAKLSKIKRAYFYSGIAALSVLLIAAGLYFFFFRVKPIDSIAVLPFKNVNVDSELEYLCDHIPESIILRLSALSDLKKITAWNSVLVYKGKEIIPQEVGRERGVDSLLISRIRQQIDEISISVELINARDGSLIWGDKYDHRLENVVAIEEEMATSIAQELKLKLTAEEKQRLEKRYTESTEAYQLYSKGVYFLRKWEALKSLEYFQQAIEKDPTYALAYEGIGWNYNVLGILGVLPPKELYPKAKEAAEKALELDETLSHAHSVLATTKLLYDWDWEAAERENKRAVELNPNHAGVHYGYSSYLAFMGRYKEALVECEWAIELDPLSLDINYFLGIIYSFMRENDRAIEQYKKILEMDPNYFVALQFLALVYADKGMYDEAIAAAKQELDLWEENNETLSTLGIIYSKWGKKDKAREMLDRLLKLKKQRYVQPSYLAIIYGYLGEMDLAFKWLEKAYEERDQQMAWLKVWPPYDSLRSDPRFKAMLKKMKLD